MLIQSIEFEGWVIKRTAINFTIQHTTYQVSKLHPDTDYQFRVSSVNKHGCSVPGRPSDLVITLDRKPSLKLGIVLDEVYARCLFSVFAHLFTCCMI